MTSEHDAVPDTVAQALAMKSFPRASTYDPAWVMANQMGPNVLWLTEYLTQSLDLRPGMRVLDLGCGKGMSSIFLAREFGVQVWATDLWIGTTDNRGRIEEAGLGDLVFPIHAEAHALPYGEDFFDAVVSIDAYQYFGTDDLYLGYVSRFVKPGGQIGVVVPGLAHEIGDTVPEPLASRWVWDFWCWHSARWWLAHWHKTGLVECVESEWMPGGWDLWMRWESLIEHLRPGESNIELLRADAGRLLGFVRVVGLRRA
jgi:cyclopropane fatty-acyl-phospholipid synthase-like methyltransferase